MRLPPFLEFIVVYAIVVVGFSIVASVVLSFIDAITSLALNLIELALG
jgi:hypothetical protein